MNCEVCIAPTSVALGKRLSLFALLMLVATSGCLRPARSPATAGLGRNEQVEHAVVLTVPTEGARLYARSTSDAPELMWLRRGDKLRLIDREEEWLLVVGPSGLRGYVEASSIFAPECTADRPAPVVVEEPVFQFFEEPPHGVVIVEGDYNAEGMLLAFRVLKNSLESRGYEQQALEELQMFRFLPPTEQCRPQPFSWTFTRRF